MRETIDQIRRLLDELETARNADDNQMFVENFDALEVLKLIAEVVDYLQPQLTTYEAAIYWYLFRHCVLALGQQYVRASVRGLMSGVVTSASGISEGLSYKAVRKALTGLEDKGAILAAGDTNRDGTLYKVCLPEEVPSAQEAMRQHRVPAKQPVDTEKELDFYNVAENRQKVFERDSYRCHYCNKQLTRFTATLDHLLPVSEGGVTLLQIWSPCVSTVTPSEGIDLSVISGQNMTPNIRLEKDARKARASQPRR